MSQAENRPIQPLTPATFHILLSLTQGAVHGYHIKRMVEERTQGAVLLGAGTLYAAIRRMTKDGLIQETDAPRDGGSVQQRREQPDRHGFPAAQDRQTSPVQANQRSDQRTRREPAQKHDGIRQPAVPHLSGKQPDVEQRK